jgi:hypothetical protein
VADRNPLAAVAHGHSLAEAIVDTVREPLVVLDRDLRVIDCTRGLPLCSWMIRVIEMSPPGTPDPIAG